MSSYVYGATEPPERTCRPPNSTYTNTSSNCKCAKTSFCAFVIVENICDDYCFLCWCSRPPRLGCLLFQRTGGLTWLGRLSCTTKMSQAWVVLCIDQPCSSHFVLIKVRTGSHLQQAGNPSPGVLHLGESRTEANGTKESPRVPRRAEALGLRGTHSAAKEIPPKAQGQGYVRKNQVAAGADLGLRGCAPQGRPEAQCFKEVESVFST